MSTMRMLLMFVLLSSIFMTSLIESAPVEDSNKLLPAVENSASESDDEKPDEEVPGNFQKLFGRLNTRQSRMFPYNSYLYQPVSQFAPYQHPFPLYYPPQFYDDFSAYYGGGYIRDDEEDLMSRKNMIPSRRPVGGYKNSQVFYVRLPPTPYMFVRGLGYISPPPTYTPPPPPPMPSPFYNLPLTFLANGKPTNIYQWEPEYAPPPPTVLSQRPPSYQPALPSMNPMEQFIQDSKVTNLKGPFLFNGRPEDIFLLPNFMNPHALYPDPRFANPYLL